MTSKKYKKLGNRNLFDKQETYKKLSLIGNFLEKITMVVEFKIFRDVLEANLLNQNKKNNAGAKLFDFVMMFKIIILQLYYRLGTHRLNTKFSTG